MSKLSFYVQIPGTIGSVMTIIEIHCHGKKGEAGMMISLPFHLFSFYFGAILTAFDLSTPISYRLKYL